ncbi:MAG: hypothetical protein NT062_30690 [Proteobacteria bacterium]|nr:hypothetical protein [Pseudomonadota bacterium]
MLHAATVPVLRWLLLAGGLVGATVMMSGEHHATTHRLRLHAVDEPDAVYLSAFRAGDVSMRIDTDHPSNITITVRADVSDGCRWLGTETLVPIDATTFAYDYSEEVVSCREGATPTRMTPRTGIVTVED